MQGPATTRYGGRLSEVSFRQPGLGLGASHSIDLAGSLAPEMKESATVSLDDLLHALEWISGDISYGNAAFVSRSTGQIFLTSTEMGFDPTEELPEDLENETLYAPV